MRLILAYITIIFINASLVGSRNGTFVTSCPFTEHTGSISVILHNFRQDNMGRIIRMLAYSAEFFVHSHLNHRHIAPIFLVTTYFGMSCMLTGHERCSGRRTYRTSGIGLRKSHPLTSHTVKVRCVDILLAIASQVVISQIIAHDINDIRFLCFLMTTTSTQQRHHGP